MNASDIIDQLGLQAHIEGGYFKRTYATEQQPRVATDNGERFSMTSIFYMLSADSPVGYFHKNEADIVHFFHHGDAIEYFLISPQGELMRHWLGAELNSQQLQLSVPGGWWKASRLSEHGRHGYGLLSEAVSPGFDYVDMELAKREELRARYPQHFDLITQLTR